ncbi:flagellar biosynthesis protein FlhF [Paenibacillus sp. DYY-L-2]|uniref:flagellar biosynthesis protein FlhF n=1 Tax=Paenibacillus sp. DYY-L-2 TaxID=3447013 RepID=UPI003F4FA8AB
MRVKRYIVDTMPDAMSKIRTDLGKDAVILSTKDIKVGGFMGMFGKKKIEVIAATEGEEEKAAKPDPKPARSPVAPMARQALPDVYKRSSEMLGASSAGPKAAPPPSPPLPTDSEEPLQAAGSQERVEVQSLDEIAATRFNEAIRQASLEQRSVPAPPKETAHLSLHQKEERLLEEIREMKAWIGQLAKQQHENRDLPEPLPEIKSRLKSQELSGDLIEMWVDAAYKEWVESGKTASPEALQQILRSEVESFLKERIGAGIRDTTRIVYIAGPTGVGKTTTIAKLAADQIFRARKKVGFITADTYRISAIEQLRTYSSILNVPLEVVQSPGDVQRALQRLSHCDLILMDTAGRNYLNEIYVAELHSMFGKEENSETYLVLSLTSKSQDMRKITEHFSRYGLDKVIFTKLDETESVGPMYNLLHEYPLKVSYIANGQNVPDDLLVADVELMMSLILGERFS